MSRIHPKTTYDPQVQTVLQGMKEKMGFTPNIFKLMAHSKAFFGGFMTLSKSLENGRLSQKVRESIALSVAGFNHCAYCTAAHSKLAATCHISPKEIALNLKSKSEEAKIGALLEFCHKVLEKRGHLEGADLEKMLHHGWVEEDLIEIIGVIALNITTNYFNNTFLPTVDF
jgi:uncharacterized peroxidase-related enzyme